MSGGYDPDFFALLDAVEDRHFWFRARGRAVAALAEQVTAPLPPGHRVLELGCGNGGMLKVLHRACPRGMVIGMDLFAEGLRHARRRTPCPLIQGDVHRPPFAARFELIGLFDVLEHIPDDRRTLDDIRALLADGGALLMTVPAHPALWSYFDEASHHCRRYTAGDLREKLTRAGLVVEYLTPFMAPLYPLMWAARRLKTWRRGAGGEGASAAQMSAAELRIVPGMNAVMDCLLAHETPLLVRRRQLAMGTSLLAIARRAR